jgi:hypothetical protein
LSVPPPPHHPQAWPADLPLIKPVFREGGANDTGGVNGTGGGVVVRDELDMGIVVYSCSFAIISLMILSQVYI